MELKDVVDWVDARLAALGMKDAQAEKKAKRPSLIQNMRKTLRNGHGSLPKLASLRDLAKVLGDPPAGLFEPLAPLNGRVELPDSPDDAIAQLEEKQAFYREKEREFGALADAIDVSLTILKQKKAG